MKMYPKVRSVVPLEDKRLLVAFDNGVRKIYNCKPLLELEPFGPLRADWLFEAVQADASGYGISWNEEIDLSEAGLWQNGLSLDAVEANEGWPLEDWVQE